MTSAATPRMGLDHIANEIALHPRLWRRHIQRGATHRWASHIAVASTYSAWLVGWPPGTGIALHDHAESDCALRVVRGQLVETGRDARHADDVEEPGWRVLPTGFVARCRPGRIHALANLDDVPALSIHVYSPVLRTMDFFRDDHGRVVASRTEEVSDDRVSLW